MSKNKSQWLYAALAGIALYTGGWFHSQYMGRVWPFTSQTIAPIDLEKGQVDPPAVDAHAGHDHAGHSEVDTLELSESAKKNLGLSEEFLKPIELTNYQQIITVPSIVVDRPGRTRLPISAAMTGIVTHVHATSGEAVETGDLLLEMRLTHEDLVSAQKDYLQSLGDRDIEMKEIARIEGIANSGAIAPKLLLDRQYNRDKLDSLLQSQREALRLHGLSEAQITTIDSERRLFTEIRVFAPGPDDHSEDEIRLTRQRMKPFQVANFQESEALVKRLPTGAVETQKSNDDSKKGHLLVLQDMRVQKGQIVNAGETLCVLADYEHLLAEGQAFEAEASQIAAAKLAGWTVTAFVSSSGRVERMEHLRLSWLNNEIDPATRTLKFYVTLNNQLVEDDRGPSGQRFISWKYRVGQRMDLGIPIAQWTDQIVLPVDAVVREGIDSFVFQQNGDHFDRIPVHEKYRDQVQVVIENDGALFPGDVVALRGAHQMQMALKSKSGGAVDPHAGHSH